MGVNPDLSITRVVFTNPHFIVFAYAGSRNREEPEVTFSQ